MKNNSIRILDILISILMLILTSPLIVLISLIIFLFYGKPIIFKQTRIGLYGKKFEILKFRTMKNEIFKNENDRLTKFGIILRRLSFDEIPQFLNVLKNDMSLVGPRPLPETNEAKIYNRFRELRNKVLPGITGFSQINYSGKYRKLNDKVKLDIKYVKNYNLYNYLKILMKTPIVLIIRLIRNKSSVIK